MATTGKLQVRMQRKWFQTMCRLAMIGLPTDLSSRNGQCNDCVPLQKRRNFLVYHVATTSYCSRCSALLICYNHTLFPNKIHDKQRFYEHDYRDSKKIFDDLWRRTKTPLSLSRTPTLLEHHKT